MGKKRSPRLGRGLSSLVATPAPADPQRASDTQQEGGPPPAEDLGQAEGNQIQTLPIDRIEPNPWQPRQEMDDASLEQLAQSIRQEGLMQPVVVRERTTPAASQAPYELVTGERRWRAAKKAGLEAVPALVRDLDDRRMAEWAVVENVQREDLDPVERAEAFRQLMEQFHLSHDAIAERVGMDRSSVSNTLRILDLHQDVREAIRQGTLSAGHGRALLAVGDTEAQRTLAKRAMAEDWSVRRTEAAVRKATELTRPKKQAKGPSGKRAAHVENLERQIGEQLQTRVTIRPGRRKGSGTISIDFYSVDQFDALLDRLGVEVR